MGWVYDACHPKGGKTFSICPLLSVVGLINIGKSQMRKWRIYKQMFNFNWDYVSRTFSGLYSLLYQLLFTVIFIGVYI